MMKRKGILLNAVLLLLAAWDLGSGDEGLWPFNMIPAESIFNKYGYRITPEWITHFQPSCVEVGGSAAFIYPEGLIITNHHVGARAIHDLSSKNYDLIKNGFYAPMRDKELRCPRLEAKVLVDIEDMTQHIQKAVDPLTDASKTRQAVRKAIIRIEKESSEETGLRCRMVTLYAGAIYHLYKYQGYDDVRLVFASEVKMANFGGDFDNYGYPRYSFDNAFFRVYKNNRPLKTKHFLPWNRSGAEENELVFCAGNPMFTFRFLTHSQMEFLRDVKYPSILTKYIRRRDFFSEFSRNGEEQARRVERDLWGALNEVKCFTGMLSGLNDKEIMKEKLRFENFIRNTVNSNPDLKKKCGRAWDNIADAQKRFTPYYKPTFSLWRARASGRSTYGRQNPSSPLPVPQIWKKRNGCGRESCLTGRFTATWR